MNKIASLPEESPDIFAPPKKGPGGKKLNSRPVVIVSIVGILFVGAIMYTVDKRSQQPGGNNGEAVENAGPKGPSEAPVKRPEGPDVEPAQVTRVAESYSASEVPNIGGMSEAELKAREKYVTDLEAAMKSSSRVENTGGKQQAQQQQMPPPPLPGNAARSMPSENQPVDEQTRKREFLEGNDDSPYLKHTRTPALSPYQINPGDVIPGLTITGINSDAPGRVIGMVSRDVYDSATGRFVLIPAGSKVLAASDSNVAAGQDRQLVAWSDIEFPDGSHLSLGSMPGADKSGITGLRDRVNNHYVRTFGQAFLVSLFGAASQLSQPRGSSSGRYSATEIMAAAVGMQAFNLGSQLIRRNLNIPPTLEVRPGTEFTILVTKKMVFPGPWQGYPLASR